MASPFGAPEDCVRDLALGNPSIWDLPGPGGRVISARIKKMRRGALAVRLADLFEADRQRGEGYGLREAWSSGASMRKEVG